MAAFAPAPLQYDVGNDVGVTQEAHNAIITLSTFHVQLVLLSHVYSNIWSHVSIDVYMHMYT